MIRRKSEIKVSSKNPSPVIIVSEEHIKLI